MAEETRRQFVKRIGAVSALAADARIARDESAAVNPRMTANRAPPANTRFTTTITSRGCLKVRERRDP